MMGITFVFVVSVFSFTLRISWSSGSCYVHQSLYNSCRPLNDIVMYFVVARVERSKLIMQQMQLNSVEHY